MIGRPRGSSWWRVRPLNLILLTLVLAPSIAAFVYAYALQNQVQATARYEIPAGPAGIVKVLQNKGITFHGQQAMNIMVLGIDYNWTDATHLPYSAGARSDTMFVLHLDKDGSRVGMLTIPRDMYIDFPDHKGHDKINGAFSDGGVKFARHVVEQFLGIHIDHYVVLRIQGAMKLVDALGGIDINVEKDMNYDDNWGYLHVHLKKGMQHLNGEQTVAYARFRHDEESDFGRIRRQQQVVDTLIKLFKQPQNYADPARLKELADLFKEYVETDFKVAEMLDLAHVYQTFDRKNFVTGFIPGTDGMVGDMSVLYPPDRAGIRAKVRQVLGGGDHLAPPDVTIEVLNGGDLPGAAGRLGDALTAKGYTVVRVADFTGAHPAGPLVVVHSDSPQVLKIAPGLLPLATVVSDKDYPLASTQQTDKGTLITIILAPQTGLDSPSPGADVSGNPGQATTQTVYPTMDVPTPSPSF